MCLQFGFVIFWQKDFGAKAAHKMLVKLTPGWRHVMVTRSNTIKTPVFISSTFYTRNLRTWYRVMIELLIKN
jgi:hypothetical protein